MTVQIVKYKKTSLQKLIDRELSKYDLDIKIGDRFLNKAGEIYPEERKMMFSEEFYPTPEPVIKKMLEPYLTKVMGKYRSNIQGLKDRTILEPSAGKGNILDYLKDKLNVLENDCSLYCIERNKELQYILNEKQYRVIGEDFLEYSGDHFFDLIIMNPPFSNGDQHLLKAWEILKQGDIVCLLSYETLNNPYTKNRKLLRDIVEEHGSYENIGDCFKTAERKTGVEVALVRLKKKGKGTFDFDFEEVNKEHHERIDEDILRNPVATRNIIGNMELRYAKVKELYIEHLKIMEGINFYSQGLLTEYTGISKCMEVEGNKKQKYNRFCDNVKKEMWRLVIQQTNLSKYMTHKVNENFMQFTEQQGAMDFTKENVVNLFETLFLNKETILEGAIQDVFDIFTKYWKENRCFVEGWKTNDKWKVNRKIILPNYVSYGSYCDSSSLKNYGDKFKLNYSYHSQYSDIDKVLCYISGKNYDQINTIYGSLNRLFDNLGSVKTGDKFCNTGASTFFNFKFWKKGTLHLEFKDKALWQEFNMRACAGKKWLPENEFKEWKAKKETPKQLNLQLSA